MGSDFWWRQWSLPCPLQTGSIITNFADRANAFTQVWHRQQNPLTSANFAWRSWDRSCQPSCNILHICKVTRGFNNGFQNSSPNIFQSNLKTFFLITDQLFVSNNLKRFSQKYFLTLTAWFAPPWFVPPLNEEGSRHRFRFPLALSCYTGLQ